MEEQKQIECYILMKHQFPAYLTYSETKKLLHPIHQRENGHFRNIKKGNPEYNKSPNEQTNIFKFSSNNTVNRTIYAPISTQITRIGSLGTRVSLLRALIPWRRHRYTRLHLRFDIKFTQLH